MTQFFTAISVATVAVPFVIILMALGVMWRSWWLYPAWGWFLVPLGVPPISFWHFAALLLLVDALRSVDTKKDERKSEWGSIVIVFLLPILVWALMRWMR